MATERITIGRVPQYQVDWVAGMTCKRQGIYSHGGCSFVALEDGVLQEPVATWDATQAKFIVTTGWGLIAYGGDLTQLTADVEQLKLDVESMILTGNDYMAAGWNPENLTAAAEKSMGTPNLVKFDFFLIDHTDNAGPYTTPRQLKRNNIFRFANGDFAPAVGITQAMADECMAHALKDVNGNVVYASGAFDPVDFYENHCTKATANGVTFLLPEKLTKDDTGVEVEHYLMPWETTETKYSNGIGCGQTLYFMQNARGASGKRWNVMSTVPKVFDGVKPIVLPPTAFMPCPVGVIKDPADNLFKTRAFFTLYAGADEGSVHCQGLAGFDNCDIFVDPRTYPSRSGINQIRNAEWGFNNNADPANNLPFACGGFNTLNAFLTYLEIKYGRRDIHNGNMFGTGISSDESDTSEETFLEHGGCRYRAVGSDTWKYVGWSVTPTNLCHDANGGKTNMSNLLNKYAPKEAVMESQVAFSFAMEMGIQEGEHFRLYGHEYWWESVTGADTADMAARVFSIRSTVFHGYDTSGNATDFEIEAVLRMSLFEGANLSGDVYAYWGGGVEVVGTNVSTTAGHSGDTVDVYVEDNQANWHRVTSYNLPDGGRFPFEETMKHVATLVTLGNGYSKDDLPNLPWKIANGGGINSGMCHYGYDYNYWGYSKVGQRVRIGLRFRGHAYYSSCSPRYLSALHHAAFYDATFCGSAQVRIAPQSATPAQPE